MKEPYIFDLFLYSGLFLADAILLCIQTMGRQLISGQWLYLSYLVGFLILGLTGYEILRILKKMKLEIKHE